jgi:hypothetical protein
LPAVVSNVRPRVALGRVALAGDPPCPVEAALPRVRRRAALGVDDAELSVGAAFVGLGQALDDLLGGKPLAQERQPVGPVAHVRKCLGGNRADVGLRRGDAGAYGEELGLHRHSPLGRLEVAGDDRVGGGFSHI